MAEKKSILDEALLDVKKIQGALNANTKEILRSVSREEINALVKESLLPEEDDFEEEDLDVAPEAGMDGASEVGDEPSFGAEPEAEMGGDIESPIAGDIDGSAEVDPLGQDSDMNASALDGIDMDMTAASDDEVIAIYKKLSGEDEIEIVGDDIHLSVTEPGEYVIKGAGAGADADAMGGDDELPSDLSEVPTGSDDMGGEEGGDDTEYEIDLDGDDAEGGSEMGGDEFGGDEPADDVAPSADDSEDDEEEVAIDEVIATNRVAQNRAGGDLTSIKGPGAKHAASLSESLDAKKILVLEHNPKFKALVNESAKLKTENEGIKQALKEMRTMLAEAVVFNSNLSYVTKLFMEHSTTKDEKKTIINRFDSEVASIKESKRLYKTIVNELSGRKPLIESIDKQINNVVTTSASKQLNENTVYVDPSTKRIIDLINRVENK